jgi:hypothetical protein
MMAFTPPGGIGFKAALEHVHRRITGGAYIDVQSAADRNRISGLSKQLRLDDLPEEQKKELLTERGALIGRPDLRRDQRRDVWQWWRGMLWAGAPPTRLLSSSGAVIDLEPEIWARERFRGDVLVSDKVSFYLPGSSGPYVGTIFFTVADLERSLVWACAQPKPLEAHATWEEIGQWSPDEATATTEAPASAASTTAPFFRNNKTAWLADKLGSLDRPALTMEEYQALAQELADGNGAVVSKDELQAEGNRLRSLHTKPARASRKK